MKKLILIIAILTTTVSVSQKAITLNINQDAKLLIAGDNKNNKAGTLDLTISTEWQGIQSQSGYVIVRPEFEYANLTGGIYRRYSANVGYSFNQWLDNVTLTATLGHGILSHNGSYLSIGNNLQVSYKLSKTLDFYLDLETVERKDLKKYDSEKQILGTAWRTSGKIGIKITIFRPQ